MQYSPVIAWNFFIFNASFTLKWFSALVLIWWFCDKIKKQILIYTCKDYFIWAAAACNLREEIEGLRWLEHCDLPNEQVSLWKLPLRVPLSKTLST